MSLRSLKKKVKTPKTSKSDPTRPSVTSPHIPPNQLLIQANEYFLAQQYDRCQQVLQAILARQADHLPALQLLGNVQLEAGRFLEALHTFELGQPLEGEDLHCSFGKIFVLLAIGRIEETFAALQQLPVKDERACEVYFKLGRRLFDNKRLEESLEAYRQALLIGPGLAIIHYNIGMIYESWGMHQEAATAYEHALARDPDMINAHVRLAKMYNKLYRTQEALVHVDQAINREGEKTDTCNIAAQIFMQQLDHDRASALFQRAIALDPENKAAHFNLIYLSNFFEKAESRELMQPSLRWVASQCPVSPLTGHNRRRKAAHERLRVGYISPDFRQHSVSYFFVPLIEAHNRDALETYCYSGVQRPDEVTRRIEQATEHWRPVGQLSDEELVQRIKEDEIDILVELSGYTFGSRLLKVLSEQPAPVQVSWLGYPNTTGMSAIHYRLTDWIADPEGEEAQYTEELFRLPASFLCYDPLDVPLITADQRAVRDREPFVFGSFNNIEKMTRPLVSLWAEILKRTPGSKLLLKSRYLADQCANQRLRDWFLEDGIPADRLDFRPSSPSRQEHFQMYTEIDLALDPFPYNGTTTTFEAIWAGVPVLTLLGDCHRSRVGASILTHLGIDDCIAATHEEYIEKAVSMATTAERMRALHTTIGRQLQQSVLMNKTLFAQQMEDAYREMWQRTSIQPMSS